MGRPSRSRHSSSNPSESFHRQLNSYALAAGATGVGVLALAQSAQARIVYTKTHQVINDHARGYILDLDNDGQGDFFFGNYGICTPRNCFDSFGLAITGKSDNFEGQSLVLALKKGVVIGPNSPFAKNKLGGLMAHLSWTSGGKINNSGGHWINVSDRFVGMKFAINGGTHFGWARLSTTFDVTNGIRATLTGYAYETIPNNPIIAGATKGPDVITVQPASLGRLALGRK